MGGDDQRPPVTQAELVLSYHRVRTALGVLGLLLPVLLLLGGLVSRMDVQPALSDYYHTLLRDIFVGTLFAIGVFLVSYKGYPKNREEWLSDDRVATLAGLAAMAVALFPNKHPFPPSDPQANSIVQVALGDGASAIMHHGAAFVFLGSLAYLSLVKFTRTAKPVRRRIYKLCGWMIVFWTVATCVAATFKIHGPPGPQAVVRQWSLVFWFEAFAVWSFAVSWLVKGRAERMLTLRRKPKG